jgi:spore germination protein
MVDRAGIEANIINSLILAVRYVAPRVEHLEDLFAGLRDGGVTSADLREAREMSEVVRGLLSGDTPLFLDGCDKALIISTKGFPNRGVQTTDTEVVVQGSKEAFTEVMRMNTVLVRRRIRDTHLKVRQFKVGRRSDTDVAVLYLEDVARPQILAEVFRKIQAIDIDGILDSGYLEQCIEGDWRSPMPQAQVTERPDKAAGAILEGRVAILVDNSPFALLVPATLAVFFQASEDYYQRWAIGSFVRLLRYLAGFLAVALPGLYLSVAMYHPSMLPAALIYKIAEARRAVPFPAAVEIFILEAAFELLREAGIRLPGPIGSTIGIVGGLIVGQAAVEAGLVSPIVVIVVALTGICGFAVPHTALVAGFRLMKILVLLCSAVLGFFGFLLGALAWLVHLVGLKSFGVPYLFPFAAGDVNQGGDFKDTLFRLPLFKMRRRPIFAQPSQSRRQR